MITAWNVLSMLKQLCNTEGEKEDELLSLCETALASVTGRLSEHADRSDMRIASAASALAFYNLTLKNTDSVGSFQAGDISISNSFSDKLKLAQKLKDDAFKDAYPLFKDEGFFAGSVEI